MKSSAMQKILAGMVLVLMSNFGYAATKNIVPRADNEGSLGTATTAWATINTYDINALDDLTVTDDLNVTGLATVGETLAVTGNLSTDGNLTAGNATADVFTFNGSSVVIPSAFGLFYTSSTAAGTVPALFISKTNYGRIGINNAAPTVALDVTGAITASGALIGTTLNTGQGAYELYKMDQNVDTAATPSFYGVHVSTSATSTHACLKAGAVTTLPTTGYTECDEVFNLTDHKVYYATETVSGTFSWLSPF